MLDYAAAKSELLWFTLSLAIELAPFRISVNVVSPIVTNKRT
jgi:NAD(P)-dependent dehydrogenase (short-subunit alcohol dehydrogenase family)